MSSASEPSAEGIEDSFQEKLEAARGGSRDALGKLLLPMRSALVATAHQEMKAELRAREEASDLVNDTMYDVVHDFEQFNGKNRGQFAAWVREILVHNVMNRVRYWEAKIRDMKRVAPAGSDLQLIDRPDRSPTASSLLGRREREEALWRAIERLPDDYRAVIRLRYQKGLDLPDVAAQMGRSVDATKQLWARAIKSLARELRKSPPA